MKLQYEFILITTPLQNLTLFFFIKYGFTVMVLRSFKSYCQFSQHSSKFHDLSGLWEILALYNFLYLLIMLWISKFKKDIVECFPHCFLYGLNSEYPFS